MFRLSVHTSILLKVEKRNHTRICKQSLNLTMKEHEEQKSVCACGYISYLTPFFHLRKGILNKNKNANQQQQQKQQQR